MAGTFADFLTALGQNESGNNYGFVSSVGYLGRYQFGEEALEAVGFYKGHDGTGAIDFIGGWTAKAASYGVFDKTTFLASKAAQDAAAEAWFARVDADLKMLDLYRFEGQWIAGVKVTASGLLAGAHLSGVWALKSWLETGGAKEAWDPYGTTMSSYVSKFGGYETPFFAGSHSGAETLVGGSGADIFSGGAGDDRLIGGDGLNVLRGDDGNDYLQGGAHFDDLHGNAGDDTVSGGWDGDWVVGGRDQDLLYGEGGGDVVLGNLGNDTAEGGDGADVVRGGQGDDIVRGGEGADWLSGDRGSDTLTGGSGADVFHTFAEAGLDRVLDFHAWEGDRVNVLPGTAWSVEQVGADTVVHAGPGADLVLVGVQASSLPEGWIF
ncbi:calcium-binding protein [Phenylobacterium sp.]|jgi:Ca2+-binding RTX toxin-like protein|uniref:calcium-binding protein n=1 Tax=Phenylobacterium sp. TaxID=1871053 RepID=UPI002F92BB0E